MFFKPAFPVGKKQFIKSTLGFVAIVLRKGLISKKPDGSFLTEGEYILQARGVIIKEFDHIIERLGLKKEEDDGIRKESDKDNNGDRSSEHSSSGSKVDLSIFLRSYSWRSRRTQEWKWRNCEVSFLFSCIRTGKIRSLC